MRHPCACCGSRTREEESPGSYAVCPVCAWEDDAVQVLDPSYRGGANAVSLDEARRNYAEFGACEAKFVASVRPPRPDELAE